MTFTIPSDAFLVGSLLASPSQNMLFRHPGRDSEAMSVRIEPRAMEVFEVLARSGGEVVSRSDLMAGVWPELIVTDDALNRVISTLRKVLSESFGEHDIIETIPKRGYRLSATVDMKAGQAFRANREPAFEKDGLESRPSVASLQRPSGFQLYRRTLIGVVVGVFMLVIIWSFASQEPEEILRFPRAITYDDRVERMPAISPDESRVAFSRTDSDGSTHLVIRLLDGESELEITDGNSFDAHPDWSSDGASIVFWRWDGGCSLNVVPSLGGEVRKLANCNGIYPDVRWGPQDDFVVYSSRATDTGPFSIYMLELESGMVRQITNPDSTSWGDHDPIMTPDRSRITFTRSFSEGMQDQFVVDLDTGVETRLTNDGRLIRGASLVPDGNRVVIASNRGGSFGLWDIPLTGGVPRPVAVADNRIRYIDIGPLGRSVYERSRGEVHLEVISLLDDSLWHAKQSVVLTSGDNWNMHPAIQPESSAIAWISNQSGSYEVWYAESVETTSRRLTDFGSGFTSRPAWSDDGVSLVFVSRHTGNPELFMIENQGLPVRLTSTDASELAPSFSRDGRHVYFTSEQEGSWIAQRLNLDSGRVEDIVPNAMGLREAPDGSGFYYARTDRDGLFFRSAPEREETLIAGGYTHSDWGNFDFRGEDIVYYARQEQAVKQWHKATNSISVLLREVTDVPSWDPGLAVLSDSTIMLAREGIPSGDVFVLELLD